MKSVLLFFPFFASIASSLKVSKTIKITKGIMEYEKINVNSFHNSSRKRLSIFTPYNIWSGSIILNTAIPNSKNKTAETTISITLTFLLQSIVIASIREMSNSKNMNNGAAILFSSIQIHNNWLTAIVYYASKTEEFFPS